MSRWPILAVAAYAHLVPLAIYARDAWAIERIEPAPAAIACPLMLPPIESPPDPCGRHRHLPRDVVQPAPATCEPVPVVKPPPVPTDLPAIVARQMPRFVRGDRDVRPSADVIAAMQRADQTEIRGSFNMCLDVRGRVASVSVLRSSGYPSYDRAIQRAVRDWRYVPYMLDGTPYATCTSLAVLFTTR